MIQHRCSQDKAWEFWWAATLDLKVKTGKPPHTEDEILNSGKSESTVKWLQFNKKSLIGSFKTKASLRGRHSSFSAGYTPARSENPCILGASHILLCLEK